MKKLELKVEECIDGDELTAFEGYPDIMDIDTIDGEDV